jgi:putative component of toxin-antitoxin plasmid stabilization module
MPPKKSVLGDSNYVRRVKSSDIDQLRQWIARGAPDDDAVAETKGTASDQDIDHWAFKAPKRPKLPAPRDQHLIRTPIDAFVLAELEERGLTFNGVANRYTLIRRASFDLLGLPPDAGEVHAFLSDERPDAYDRLVDRLLQSPAYGERWGKYWLDAAGYADTNGVVSRDQYRKYMWRYRDYVVRSHNHDKSYARFLTEQIAGDELDDYSSRDELTASQLDNLIATGFLRTATDSTDELGFNFIPNRLAVLNDQIDILGSAVLGLTMECSRCHDHKFDPLPQRDYYRFSAIFRAAYDPFDWRVPNAVVHPRSQPIPREYQRYLNHGSDTDPLEIARHNRPFREEIVAAKQELNELEKGSSTDPKRVDELRKRIADAEGNLFGEMRIHGLTDNNNEPTPVFVLNRGEYRAPRAKVEPGVPLIFSTTAPYDLRAPANPKTTGRRLAFAKWLVQKKHPLTSRVIVNRIWQYHFGRGIVDTPGNFGVMGSLPTHPELLDWLALELERQNWSLKSLHRLIMTSAVYRQSSRTPKHWKGGADNVHLSRFPLRRLDGDAIRDSILQVTGRLNNVAFGPADDVERTPEGYVLVREECGKGQRRSIYIARRRSMPVTMLETFDQPQLFPNCLQPTKSTVSNQALQLWNGQLVRKSAEILGRRIATQSDETATRLRLAYETSLSRPPTTGELDSGSRTIEELTSEWRRHLKETPDSDGEAAVRAIVTFCHVLLNSPEFIYVD